MFLQPAVENGSGNPGFATNLGYRLSPFSSTNELELLRSGQTRRHIKSVNNNGNRRQLAIF